MAIEEHIRNHMRLDNIPPLHEWTSIDLPPIERKVLAHIRGAVGQNNLQGSTIRFWYHGDVWFAVVGVILQENITRDWTAVDIETERIIQEELRQATAAFNVGRAAVSYQLALIT